MTEKTKTKREFKDHTSITAWQIGHETAKSAETKLQEYASDPDVRKWCEDLMFTYRDAVVQVGEGFYKRGVSEKVRRYEAALFYIRRAAYTLRLGDELGWWELKELEQETKNFEDVTRRTMYKLMAWAREIEENGAKVMNDD